MPDDKALKMARAHMHRTKVLFVFTPPPAQCACVNT